MVRNAGGRVFDAIRTLAVLQTIGQPGTIAVMHHTGTLLLLDLKAIA
jgi:carbonic anhydrase